MYNLKDAYSLLICILVISQSSEDKPYYFVTKRVHVPVIFPPCVCLTDLLREQASSRLCLFVRGVPWRSQGKLRDNRSDSGGPS